MAKADDPSSDAGNVYENAVGRSLGPAGGLSPARVSASVVLWRHFDGGGPDDVEVFWVKRAETLAFMGGWHAFPGGGWSRADPALPVLGEPQMPFANHPPSAPSAEVPESLRDLDAPSPDLLPGLAACALRELFEETGVLVSEPAADPERLPELRRREVDDAVFKRHELLEVPSVRDSVMLVPRADLGVALAAGRRGFVERLLEENPEMSPREATIQSMGEIRSLWWRSRWCCRRCSCPAPCCRASAASSTASSP